MPKPNELELPEDPSDALFDRVDQLLSALVDELITDQEIAELEGLLHNSEDARRRYVEGMQMHSDLVQHFRPESSTKGASVIPILGHLGEDPNDSGVALPPSNPADKS